MTLAAGDKLGPYEIREPIGAGGMGEVYRALDPRLGREVAIKVSSERFTERFGREARAVAALNHPNICTLFDVGPNYLVMELIEGETLKGPLPIATALNYARQIASALEAAHEKGIVHRDLKPGNIKIKPDGTVKVLDFGLAKISDPVAANPNPQSSPTLTLDATRMGVILGTAAYMSPEQARGEPVDQRADIWAFGVVLYEMLAGQRIFEARTVADTLAAVLIKEPDLDRVPPQVRPVLRRCLAKEPKQRLRDIADVRLLLEETKEELPAASPPPPPRFGMAGWIAAALLGLALGAVSFFYYREKPPAAEVMRFQIFPPENRNFAWANIALSPDGRRIAFSTLGPDGRNQLWVRGLDSLESRPLAGTEGADLVFWSPDGRFLGFELQGKLKKVDASGGTPQTVCDIPRDFRGGAWSPEGVIVFGSVGSGLLRVAAAGGVPSEITKLDPSRGEVFHASPNFLPDGRHFLYTRNVAGAGTRGTYLGSLDSKPEQQSSTPLMPSYSSAVYAPNPDRSSIGHIVFAQESSLMAQPFDTRRMELAGETMPLVDSMGDGSGNRWSVSDTGVLAYRTVTRFGGSESQFTWFDRAGKPLGTVGERGQYTTAALSPDGTRMAFGRLDTQVRRSGSPPFDVWVHEFGRTSTRLTTNPGTDDFATWSADGNRIVFSSLRNRNSYNLYQKSADGAGNEELLFQSDEDKFAQDSSRDGRYLLFSTGSRTETGNYDLWMLPLTPGNAAGKAEPYLKTQFSESQGRFSPDGRFVAYRSDASGKHEIYVQPFPDPSSRKWTISIGGGVAPRWQRDGKELYYISADSKMMAVEVSTTPVFTARAPKVLFQVPIRDGASAANRTRYDVTADGKRFLINTEQTAVVAPPIVPITVIVNWPALLKK